MRELLLVRTPENVTFEFELAGLGRRAVAWSLDLTVIAALVLVASLALSTVSVALGALGTMLQFVVIFVIQWGYATAFEWLFGGRTVGKWMLGLRVMGDDGLAPSLIACAIRNLLRVVDFLPVLYGVGAVVVLTDPLRRRSGDFAAGTLVVMHRPAPVPAAILSDAERRAALTDPSLRLVARRVSPAEREVLLALALRREELSLEVRHALFEQLADHFARRLGLERPAHLSAEKVALQLAANVLGAEVTP